MQRSRNLVVPLRELIATCVLVVVCMPLTGAANGLALTRLLQTHPPQTGYSTSTPLERRIEAQRARLNSSDMEERRDAVTRLGALARPESSRAAATALGDQSAIVRATAARAILSLDSDEAAGLLIPLLGDRDEFVRRETAYALGVTRSRRAVEPLITALGRDKNAGVRGAAAVALGQISDPSAVPALMETLGRRFPAPGLLNRIRGRKTEENEFVRRAAAVSLGQLGSRDAVPTLISVLTNERAGDDVRREAARSLGIIGDSAAVPALRAVLTTRDPLLSRIAYEALRKINPSISTQPI